MHISHIQYAFYINLQDNIFIEDVNLYIVKLNVM